MKKNLGTIYVNNAKSVRLSEVPQKGYAVDRHMTKEKKKKAYECAPERCLGFRAIFPRWIFCVFQSSHEHKF